MRIILVFLLLVALAAGGCTPKVEIVPEPTPPTPLPPQEIIVPDAPPAVVPTEIPIEPPVEETEEPLVEEPPVIEEPEEAPALQERDEPPQTQFPPHETEMFLIETKGDETTVKIKLDYRIEGLNELIGVETDNGRDVLLIVEYDKDTKSLIVSGLRPNTSRTLTVSYWVNK